MSKRSNDLCQAPPKENYPGDTSALRKAIEEYERNSRGLYHIEDQSSSFLAKVVSLNVSELRIEDDWVYVRIDWYHYDDEHEWRFVCFHRDNFSPAQWQTIEADHSRRRAIEATKQRAERDRARARELRLAEAEEKRRQKIALFKPRRRSAGA